MRQLESFFWGIIAALGALVMELVFSIAFSTFGGQLSEISFSQFYVLPQFIVVGVLIEELFKYLIISKQIDEFSFGRSYLINSFFVGLGFFAAELGIISISASMPQTSLLLEIATIHIGTAGLIGYIVATKNPKKLSTAFLAIAVAAIFHGAYNFLALERTPIFDYAIFATLGILIFFNILNLIRINNRLAQD